MLGGSFWRVAAEGGCGPRVKVGITGKSACATQVEVGITVQGESPRELTRVEDLRAKCAVEGGCGPRVKVGVTGKSACVTQWKWSQHKWNNG